MKLPDLTHFLEDLCFSALVSEEQMLYTEESFVPYSNHTFAVIYNDVLSEYSSPLIYWNVL